METDCSFIDYSFINLAGTESLLTTSQYAKVIFHNIEEKYSLNTDLVCQYSLTDQFSANPGDRIILFRLGWQQVTDYVLFQWAQDPQENKTLQVVFEADSLPKDTNEFYQLCYISGENSVCGASVPFQFTNSSTNLITSTISDCFVSFHMDSSKVNKSLLSTSGVSSSSSQTPDGTIEEKILVSSKESIQDIEQLKEENKVLKSDLIKTSASLEQCNNQIMELKNEMDSLRGMFRVTQNDVADLKLRMEMAGEEYKKMFAEKVRVERKYEKLVKKCQSKKVSESSGEPTYDLIGELEPLPPFPLLM